MANTRPRKAKAPPSSPLSSAPSSPSSAPSPPSAPSSPYRPTLTRRKAPVKTYKSRKASKKAAPAPAPTSSPPPSSLDDLLGNMDQDRELKLKRDNSRRKTLNLIDSAPSSQASAAAKPKRKRKAVDEGGRPSKKRSPSLDELEEEGGDAPFPEVPSREASPSAPSPAGPSSPLSPPRPLAGPSKLRYPSSGETDEEDENGDDDLGAALSRHKVEITKAEVFDGELSDPPTPPAPAWRKNVHPGVEPGDTCLVMVSRQWFPAKLLQLKPAESPRDRDFYEVQTQDGRIYHPARKSLLFLDEGDAIARAKIGVYDTRPAGPDQTQTLGPDASEYERFQALELSAQVENLQGHLDAVAGERYLPAQWRIDMFFEGKGERERLKAEIAYGDLKDSEVKDASRLLSDWVGEHEGTGRFATLAEDERSQFASFVLLPEVIVAICLRSLDLDQPSSWARPRDDLPPPEEAAEREAARLYALARRKLDELRACSHALEWEKRRDEVKRTQQAAQKAAGTAPAAPAASEPGKRPTRRAARLRQTGDELSPQRQAQLEAAFEREKKKAERAKQRKRRGAESAETASASAEASAGDGREAVEGEASATHGGETPEGGEVNGEGMAD